MRVLSLALLLIAGCNFHIDGTAPPGGGVSAPGDPAAAPPPTGTPVTPDPTPPTGGNSPTPAAPPPDLATAVVGTTTGDMGPTTPVVHVGAACNANPDCMEADLQCYKSLGALLTKINLPGGYCSKPCDSKTPCPTGSECVATGYGDFCMNKCGDGSNKGCRSGYACCDSVDACGLKTFCGN